LAIPKGTYIIYEISDKVTLNEVKGLKKPAQMLHFPSLRSGQAFPGKPGRGRKHETFLSDLIDICGA
jgi:hypothetical protein